MLKEMDAIKPDVSYIEIDPDSPTTKLPATYYTTVQWEEPYRVSVRYFCDTTIPALQALGDPNDVRIIFWFDN